MKRGWDELVPHLNLPFLDECTPETENPQRAWQTLAWAFNLVNTKPLLLIGHVCSSSNTCVTSRIYKWLLGCFLHQKTPRRPPNIPMFLKYNSSGLISAQQFLIIGLTWTNAMAQVTHDAESIENKSSKEVEEGWERPRNHKSRHSINKSEEKRGCWHKTRGACRRRRRCLNLVHTSYLSSFLFYQLSGSPCL